MAFVVCKTYKAFFLMINLICKLSYLLSNFIEGLKEGLGFCAISP